ncbi:response regulator [Cohnella endophytica]|uniref:Response regulator n=1 Tax=Cohnella endophytica TaxID=2419778 RepID=A0A494Y3M8_9BACL|nr:helix-turn-helix domain-containing protein [Cohnella endophytica]RKP57356.1 response regulator [Cohnella endophytica]
MKVLVVDDQRLSRAGIIKMIEWEKLGLRLAGECSNGYEALETMNELEVDVVITDVRMPVLDGLQLIEQAKELYPHIAFLVISGFDDYAYVRKSIHLSVADYMLKPVDKLELNTLLRELIEKTQDARNLAATQLHKTREQFLHLLIEGAYDEEKQMIEDWSDIRLPDQENCFFAAMFDCEADKNKVNGWFRFLSDRCEIFLFRTRGNCYSLVAAGSEGVVSEVDCILRTMLSDREIYQLAGIGTVVFGIDRLKESLAKAYDAYTLQASLPENITGQENIPAAHASSNPSVLPLNATWEREWFILMKQGNRSAILSKIEELGSYQGRSTGETDWIESIYPYVLLRGAKEMFETGLINEQAYLDAFQIAKKLPYVAGIEARREIVGDYFSRSLDMEPQSQIKKVKEAIEKAKTFVDANFRQTINLTDLALTYYMSPGYFSTLFRQHTGRNFLEYLTQLRMEHAKWLIASNTNGKISDIAIQCGYQDLKYFRKLFKRYTGVTPLQYKEDSKLD